ARLREVFLQVVFSCVVNEIADEQFGCHTVFWFSEVLFLPLCVVLVSRLTTGFQSPHCGSKQLTITESLNELQRMRKIMN
ncbi:MAG: hypothetical protein ACYDH9_14240, partial [Limisphaerales bacterium]